MTDTLKPATTTLDVAKPSKRPTREIDVTELSADFKQRKKRAPLKYGAAITALLGALGTGGYGLARGETQETKQARVEERLQKHDEKLTALDGGLAKLDERLRNVERDTAVTKSNTKLILRALKVKVEDEP